jgi:LacI family transcriptional regulator
METNKFDHLKLFSEKNIPLVFFDRVVDEIEANKIVVDDFGGGFKATKHLIEQGCKNIAHIGGPLNLNIYNNRLDGYRAALKESGFKTNEAFILHNSLTRKDGEEAIKHLLKLPKIPDGIFCANDTTALSVITYLKSINVKMPDEIAVVGFSNEPFSEVVTPSISTIKQPGFQMGQKAAELLLDQINGKTSGSQFKTIVMPTELIVRESSKKN